MAAALSAITDIHCDALRLMGVLEPAAPAGDREGPVNGASVAPAIAAPCPACSAVLAAPERWSDDRHPINAPVSAASAAPERWGDDDAFTKLPTKACEKGDSTSHLLQSVNRGVKSWDAPHLAEAHDAPATPRRRKYKFSNRRECMSTDLGKCAHRHGRGELRNQRYFSCKTLPLCAQDVACNTQAMRLLRQVICNPFALRIPSESYG
jgi:hypothetical protein